MTSKVAFLSEKVVREQRLGRHVEHDPRSRNYSFAQVSASLLKGVSTVEHRIQIPVLNQGNVGACTGFAMEACAGSSPFLEAIPEKTASRPKIGKAAEDQKQALALYATATTLDTFYGSYPPSDTGSTGLAVAKAAQRAGLIAGYLHTFTFEDCLRALTLTPVLVGVNWYSGFDNPGKDGLVRLSGRIRGGHEFLLYGLNVEKKIVRARNSWGSGWGQGGSFSLTFKDLERLLSEQGDCTVPVPLGTAGKKAESEKKNDPDQVLLAAVETWKKAKGL